MLLLVTEPEFLEQSRELGPRERHASKPDERAAGVEDREIGQVRSLHPSDLRAQPADVEPGIVGGDDDGLAGLGCQQAADLWQDLVEGRLVGEVSVRELVDRLGLRVELAAGVDEPLVALLDASVAAHRDPERYEPVVVVGRYAGLGVEHDEAQVPGLAPDGGRHRAIPRSSATASRSISSRRLR